MIIFQNLQNGFLHAEQPNTPDITSELLMLLCSSENVYDGFKFPEFKLYQYDSELSEFFKYLLIKAVI